ncbi:hypothetical protein KP22_03955 [Pectobacterium betavasculorum]|uniref:Uncharacterized protein n=1 Tax=Pectobacterium betavasculorum TaxID=55207 RepID=A0A093S355_9GAMM|nr:hypothetical protein [Pectobacterium betavasculorum]KFX07254.1 hypothetical protein KP22_03955 [Pectobacterium betavasculorum]
MSFLSGLFKGKKRSRDDICAAILSFCYGNMLNLSKSNPKAFAETFYQDPTKSLRARIFSSSHFSEWETTPLESLSMIKAKFIRARTNELFLLFDFSEVSGIFTINDGKAICPSYVGLLFDQSITKPPRVYFLEPSVEPGTTMIIKVTHDRERFNLGNGPYNTEAHFIDYVLSLSDCADKKNQGNNLDHIDDVIMTQCHEYIKIIDELNNLQEAEKIVFARGFYNTYKIFIDKYKSIDNFINMSEREKDNFLSKLDDYTLNIKEIDYVLFLGSRALFLCLQPIPSFGREVTDRMLSVIAPLIPVD